MDKKRSAAGTKQESLRGLKLVTCGMNKYVGKISDVRSEGLPPGYVMLEQAFELLIQVRPGPHGMEVNMAPMAILPHPGKADIMLRTDSIVDVSEVEDMIQIVEMADQLNPKPGARSGLVLPSSAVAATPEQRAALERRLRGGQ
jgi:hypothetical protein